MRLGGGVGQHAQDTWEDLSSKCHAIEDFFAKRSASKSCSSTIQTKGTKRKPSESNLTIHLVDFEAVFAGRPVAFEPHSVTFFSVS